MIRVKSTSECQQDMANLYSLLQSEGFEVSINNSVLSKDVMGFGPEYLTLLVVLAPLAKSSFKELISIITTWLQNRRIEIELVHNNGNKIIIKSDGRKLTPQQIEEYYQILYSSQEKGNGDEDTTKN